MADTIVDDSVSTVVNELNYTYESNDICLTIYPYDNYKKISLYENVNGANVEYDIDRSDYYRFYLEFGDGIGTNKKKVRIKECKDYVTSDGNNVKLALNELLFKITQSEAYDILSLNSKVFNVVREVIVNDGTQDVVSEIQTVFVGKWATSEDRKNTDTAVLITELKNRISELMSLNDELNARLIETLSDVSQLTSENERLKEYEKYKDMYDELYNETQQGTEYSGTAIEYDAKYIKVNIADDELENKVNEYLDTINV